jgi:hypothetical protein
VPSDKAREILAYAIENKLVILDYQSDNLFVFVLKKACSGAMDASKAQKEVNTMLMNQGISQPTWDRFAAIVIGELDADLKNYFAITLPPHNIPTTIAIIFLLFYFYFNLIVL